MKIVVNNDKWGNNHCNVWVGLISTDFGGRVRGKSLMNFTVNNIMTWKYEVSRKDETYCQESFFPVHLVACLIDKLFFSNSEMLYLLILVF